MEALGMKCAAQVWKRRVDSRGWRRGGENAFARERQLRNRQVRVRRIQKHARAPRPSHGEDDQVGRNRAFSRDARSGRAIDIGLLLVRIMTGDLWEIVQGPSPSRGSHGPHGCAGEGPIGQRFRFRPDVIWRYQPWAQDPSLSGPSRSVTASLRPWSIKSLRKW